MKKYVFTIKDDVCTANGKDIEATELREKMKLWGDVEEYDKAIAPVVAEYQYIIDNLTAQLQAIKDQELTPDEMRMVEAYRANKTAVVNEFIAEADRYKSELKAIRSEYEQKTAQLKAILDD